jgi:hypothetical protein
MGHLVQYDANGTDREGLRGAQNTWLEICTQAYCTRRLKEADVLRHPTGFAAFIDDAVRCIPIPLAKPVEYKATALRIIKEVEFSLKIVGRELSWDKAYASHVLVTMLNEMFLQAHPYGGGIKSFCTMHEHETSLVDNLVSLEADHFSKAQGALGSGTPAWLSHFMYLFAMCREHMRFGINFNTSEYMTKTEHMLWCLTPVAFGGAGLRSQLQLMTTETGNSIAAGLGNLRHYAVIRQSILPFVNTLVSGSLERLKPLDFLRDPTQFHVVGPRLRSQRLATIIRNTINEYIRNPRLRDLTYSVKLAEGSVLAHAKALQKARSVSAVEVREYYRSTPLKELDDLITKIVSSESASTFVRGDALHRLRSRVRLDALDCARVYRLRCSGISVAHM